MRYLMIVFCSLVLVAGVMAQDQPEENKNLVFAGYMYDDGPLFVSGAGYDLGKGVWTFIRGVTGDDQTVAVDVAYLIWLSDLYPLGGFADKIFIGPIAGPEADWVNTESDEVPTLSYLNGAAGVIVGIDPFESGIFQSASIWGAYKNKFTFEENSYEKTGWMMVAGVGWKF